MPTPCSSACAGSPLPGDADANASARTGSSEYPCASAASAPMRISPATPRMFAAMQREGGRPQFESVNIEEELPLQPRRPRKENGQSGRRNSRSRRQSAVGSRPPWRLLSVPPSRRTTKQSATSLTSSMKCGDLTIAWPCAFNRRTANNRRASSRPTCSVGSSRTRTRQPPQWRAAAAPPPIDGRR